MWGGGEAGAAGPPAVPQAPQRGRCGPESLALEVSCYRAGTEAEAGSGVHGGQDGVVLLRSSAGGLGGPVPAQPWGV